MIDQPVNMDPVEGSDDNTPVLATKANEPSIVSSENTQAQPIRVVPNHAAKLIKTSPLLTFGSRGSVMLKAALNDLNRQYPKVISVQTPPVNRRRPFRNKVLFTDPVVSKKFTYEPTPVIQYTYCERRQSSSPDSDDSDQQQMSNQSQVATSSRRNRLMPAKKSRKIPSGEDDDDDDDCEDVFVLASPDLPPGMLDLNKKSPIKRPHELTLTSSEEEESFANSSDQNPQGRTSSRDDGCLFSSPKVAKIAPYYDELEETKKLDLSSKASSCAEGAVEKTDAPCAAPATLLSYLHLSSAAKSNQIQSSNQCKAEAAEYQSIFGLFGSLWSQTTSYLFPERS